MYYSYIFSARKRMMQKLNDEDIPANQIVQISGHKNINSINNYSKINTHQAKRISNILSDRKVSDPQMQNTNAPPNSLQNPMSRGFFINTQFHGNVTFNFCSSESKNVSQNVQHNSALSVAAARSPRDSREQCSQSPIRPNYKRIRMLSDSESD